MPKKRFILFNKNTFHILVKSPNKPWISSDLDKMIALRNAMNKGESVEEWAVCELVPYDEENDTLKEVKG